MNKTIENLGSCIDPSADGNKPALIICGGGQGTQTLTYAALRQKANDIANYLQTRGLPHGCAIGILAANHDDYFPVFLGVMLAGFTACPLNWKLNSETLDHMARDTDIRFLFTDKKRAKKFSTTVEKQILGEAHYHKDSNKKAIQIASLPTTDDIACIMFTSGSTGMPKAVPITHSGYLWGIECFQSDAELMRRTRFLTAAPLFHMNAQCTILLALRYSGTVIVMREFDTDGFLSAIEEFQVTQITGVPTMMALAMRRLKTSSKPNFSSVEKITLGSAPLSKMLYTEIQTVFPGVEISNGYGTTETGFVAFGSHPDPTQTTPPSSIGYPRSEVDVRLVGPEAPERGVLEIKTGMMTKGYINNPDKTAERFINGYYHTGDIMRRDENGFYYFVEREDDMFVCGGENIYPAEVELILEKHPDILQSVVVPIPHATKGEAPVAFIVTRTGHALSEKTIKEFALEHGPAYAHPRRIFFINEVPLASTGKIDRANLHTRALELIAASS